MARTSATNVSAQIDLEPGVYAAKIVKVSDAGPSQNSQYDKGLPREVVEYRIYDDDGDPIADERGEPLAPKQWVTIYNPMRPKSAIYGVVAAVMYGAQEIPEGADIDTADLVGKRCMISWGKRERGEGMGITAVYPPRKAKAKAKTVTAEEIDDI